MNDTQKVKIFFDPNCQQCLREMNAIRRTDNCDKVEFAELLYEKSRIASLIDSLQILSLSWMKTFVHDKNCGHSSIE
jgi:predicted DCC family thiol-disulfide oxidoreductase YuxK